MVSTVLFEISHLFKLAQDHVPNTVKTIFQSCQVSRALYVGIDEIFVEYLITVLCTQKVGQGYKIIVGLKLVHLRHFPIKRNRLILVLCVVSITLNSVKCVIICYVTSKLS